MPHSTQNAHTPAQVQPCDGAATFSNYCEPSYNLSSAQDIVRSTPAHCQTDIIQLSVLRQATVASSLSMVHTRITRHYIRGSQRGLSRISHDGTFKKEKPFWRFETLSKFSCCFLNVDYIPPMPTIRTTPLLWHHFVTFGSKSGLRDNAAVMWKAAGEWYWSNEYVRAKLQKTSTTTVNNTGASLYVSASAQHSWAAQLQTIQYNTTILASLRYNSPLVADPILHIFFHHFFAEFFVHWVASTIWKGPGQASEEFNLDLKINKTELSWTWLRASW